MAKKAKYISIYIDLKEIVITAISCESNLITIETEIKIQTNFNVKDKIIKPISLNTEFFNEKQEWVAKFKEAIKSNNLTSTKAIITLSQSLSVTRFFTMPYIDRKFWHKSIFIESKKYIPVSFDEMTYDFIAKPIANNTKLGVLFSITQKKTIEFIMEVFKSLSINLDRMETSVLSFERFLSFIDPKEHDKKIYIFFKGDSFHSILSWNNCPIVYRESLTDSASTLSERKYLDLKSSISFVKRYIPDQQYNQIVLAGENASLWKTMAESESGLKAEIIDINKNLKNVKEINFSLLSSLGAGLAFYKDILPIDISGISNTKKMDIKARNIVFFISSLLTLLFLSFSLLNNIKASNLSSQISSTQEEMGELTDFQGMTDDMIKRKVEGLKQQSALFNNLFKKKEYLAPKLSVIAEVIPNEIWLESIVYLNRVAEAQLQNQTKELDLKGKTILKGEKKFTIIDEFMKSLKTSPEFKSFPSIDKNIEGASGKKNPYLPQDSMEDLNEISEFTITCSQEAK